MDVVLLHVAARGADYSAVKPDGVVALRAADKKLAASACSFPAHTHQQLFASMMIHLKSA